MQSLRSIAIGVAVALPFFVAARGSTAQGSAQGQSGSMQGMQMGDGGMMGTQGMPDAGMAMADGGMMGGRGMDGMMQGGMMSCSQMMGGADVTVQNTKDGATIHMRAKSKDQVQHVQQMARMMKNCMSGQH